MNKYHPPNHAQMSTAVKGHDRRKRHRLPWWLGLVLHGVAFLVVAAAFLIALIIIAEVLRGTR
jgi:hypothetical protein